MRAVTPTTRLLLLRCSWPLLHACPLIPGRPTARAETYYLVVVQDDLPTACTSASTERETCHSGGLNTPSPPAPSADLLGVPVSRGALSQIGKRSLSSGSGRRHAWDSRPLPTGHYRNLLFFLCLGFAKVQLRSLLMDVRVRGRDTESMATARDHSTATVCGPQ
jgi:hypothetical protein